MTWDDISKIYEEIELMLLESFKRNLSGHEKWEEQEGFKWPAWQAEKIRNLENFQRENKRIMTEKASVSCGITEALLQAQYAEGMERVRDEVQGNHVSAPTEASFFGVNDRKLQSLIDDMQQTETKAESAALRLMDDVYRQTVYKAQTAMAAGAVTLPKAIDMATEDFLKKGIDCIEYRNGARVNIADYVQMALRTASTRAYLQGEAKQRDELGIDTVLVSQYGACSETCLPWQGRVYIDDVWGSWNGERYGTRGKSKNGFWYPLLSVAIRYGLFHPNCRHTLLTWQEGISTMPKPLDGKRVRRTAKLEQEQRALERNVRKWKRVEAGSLDQEDRKRAKKKRMEAQKRVREFVAEHEDVLRRDYWREKVYTAPQMDGIIQTKESDLAPYYSDKFGNKPVTNISFKRIALIGDNQWTVQQMQTFAESRKKLLKVVQKIPAGTEAGAYIDPNTGTIIGNILVGNEGRIKLPQMKTKYISLHSHPDGGIFSFSDLKDFSSHEYERAMCVVGNNGVTYWIQKLKGFKADEFDDAVVMLKQNFIYKGKSYQDILSDSLHLDFTEEEKEEIYMLLSAAIEDFLRKGSIYGIYFRRA